jgi:hypothetical protein
MNPADQRRIRAENRVRRPGLIGAQGDARDAVLELRAEAEAALAAADARLRAAADDRLAAVARIRACNRALLGTGEAIDSRSGKIVRYGWPSSDGFHDPPPDPATLELIDGEELRDELVGILGAIGRPAAVGELVRLLGMHGFRAPGRASQSVSNALRVELRAKNVERVARGTYTFVPQKPL